MKKNVKKGYKNRRRVSYGLVLKKERKKERKNLVNDGSSEMQRVMARLKSAATTAISCQGGDLYRLNPGPASEHLVSCTFSRDDARSATTATIIRGVCSRREDDARGTCCPLLGHPVVEVIQVRKGTDCLK